MISKDQIFEKLRAASISPSEQRAAIYRFLWENRIHPTAETVWSRLRAEYPTLSRTTVHNTLKLFASRQLAQALTIETDEVRFDANVNFHAHFKCRRCGKVLDVFFEDAPAIPLPSGFPGRAERLCMDYYGLCADCAD